MKSKNIKLDTTVVVPIYGHNLRMIVAEDPCVAADELYPNDNGAKHSFDAAVFNNGTGSVAIFFPTKLTHNQLGHEIRHATDRIMGWAGVILDVDNSEAHAFLAGWVQEWVASTLRMRGIRVR